jgi:hypothetical protein
MPNKDGSGPIGKGQRCRTRGLRQGARGGRGRLQHSPGARRTGGGLGPDQRLDRGKKWQRNENQ